MRVTKNQIVRGIGDYVRGEVLPKMEGNKAMQIILSIGVNAALANSKAVDAVMENSVVKALLDDDGSGTYELDALSQSMREAIERYGSFPVRIPAIPLVSPGEITLSLTSGDVESVRRQIEAAI